MKKMRIVRWPEVAVEELAGGRYKRQAILGDNMLIFRNELEAGLHFDPHSHEELIQFVIKGKLRFTSGEDVQIVGSGGAIMVPEGVEHEIEILEDALLIDVFSPPKSDFLEGKEQYSKK
jgi:quercetin dioxygenase-like cupin family protein